MVTFEHAKKKMKCVTFAPELLRLRNETAEQSIICFTSWFIIIWAIHRKVSSSHGKDIILMALLIFILRVLNLVENQLIRRKELRKG